MISRAKPGLSKADVIVLLAVAGAVVAAVLFVARSDFFGVRGPRFNPEFAFREQTRQIPRRMVRYERVLTVPTGFASAAAIAVDSQDCIYVAGDRAVRAWDSAGKRLRIGIAGLKGDPRCIAVGGDGRVYVGMDGRVEMYSPAGKLVGTVGPYTDDGVVKRIVLAAGGMFLAVHKSLGSGFILQYDLSGKLQRAIALAGVTLLSRHLDVAVTADGLRVTDPGAVEAGRIRVYGFDGRQKYAWGRYDTSGDLNNLSGCCNPVHLAALPDGRIVTSEKGAQVIVKVYHRDTPDDHSRVESVVAELRGAEGLDLAVDSRQRILVLDAHASAVYVYQRTGS
jgi:hypothetical protein